MKCSECNSNRVMRISAKCVDMFWASYKDKEYDGYVLNDIGIDDGTDYVDFSYYLECGKIQGVFPVEDPDFGGD